MDGTVKKVGLSTDYGNFITIEHTYSIMINDVYHTFTYYPHLSVV